MRPVAIGLWCALAATQASADLSASLALVSDYRYRGLSLSDGQPAAQANLAYDHPDGWYAGLFGSTVRLPERSGIDLQVLAYLGYTGPVRAGLAPGLHWETGATYSTFTGGGEYAYPQLYLGLTGEHFSARIYYAFDYFGLPADALYAELNLTRPLSGRLRLLGHAGLLQLRESDTDDANPVQLDYRIGLGLDLQEASLQLTWEGTDPSHSRYPLAEGRGGAGLVLSLSRSF